MHRPGRVARGINRDEEHNMDPKEARELIAGRTLSLPYTILTQGGRAYRVAHHTNAWIADAYPETLMLAVPGEGLIRIGLGAIESIQDEHEPRS
jgi:hypothetical protein